MPPAPVPNGFGQDGTADQMHPVPLLATLVHAATRNGTVLAALSEDDLAGIIRGARKLESFVAWAQLTALREFATRRAPALPSAPPATW
jgi:hypothetical protein